MSTFSDINNLRTTGHLEEAKIMALDALEKDSDNIWNKRAASWVYYEFLKKYSKPLDYEGFKNNLISLKELNLPDDENMVFDNSAWQIGSIVFQLSKSEHIEYDKLNEVFETIKSFHFTKPSSSYTFIYKAFHKAYQNRSNYLNFADWWGFKNFQAEDYSKEEYNGKSIMAIAEQAYIAYSKKLLDGDFINENRTENKIDKDRIEAFLPKLKVTIEKHPEYQYPAYYMAKLLLATDEGENALSSFLPFAKKKKNEFWVWELMAEIFEGDTNLTISCYCKALSLNTPEDFLVKTRQGFAKILFENKLYEEARVEIEKVVETRTIKGWRIPNQIIDWKDSDWFTNSKSKDNNDAFYKKHKSHAEEILFNDIPEQVIAIEFVNTDKKILNFVKNKDNHGFFNYESFNIKPDIGDVLKVRLKPVGNEGFYRVLTLKKADEENENCKAIKTSNGQIEIISDYGFAFLNDVFIDPNTVKKHQLKNNEEVSCKAILSYNKKKEEWGWKCFEIHTN